MAYRKEIVARPPGPLPSLGDAFVSRCVTKALRDMRNQLEFFEVPAKPGKPGPTYIFRPKTVSTKKRLVFFDHLFHIAGLELLSAPTPPDSTAGSSQQSGANLPGPSRKMHNNLTISSTSLTQSIPPSPPRLYDDLSIHEMVLAFTQRKNAVERIEALERPAVPARPAVRKISQKSTRTLKKNIITSSKSVGPVAGSSSNKKSVIGKGVSSVATALSTSTPVKIRPKPILDPLKIITKYVGNGNWIKITQRPTAPSKVKTTAGMPALTNTSSSTAVASVDNSITGNPKKPRQSRPKEVTRKQTARSSTSARTGGIKEAQGTNASKGTPSKSRPDKSNTSTLASAEKSVAPNLPLAKKQTSTASGTSAKSVKPTIKTKAEATKPDQVMAGVKKNEVQSKSKAKHTTSKTSIVSAVPTPTTSGNKSGLMKNAIKPTSGAPGGSIKLTSADSPSLNKPKSVGKSVKKVVSASSFDSTATLSNPKAGSSKRKGKVTKTKKSLVNLSSEEVVPQVVNKFVSAYGPMTRLETLLYNLEVEREVMLELLKTHYRPDRDYQMEIRDPSAVNAIIGEFLKDADYMFGTERNHEDIADNFFEACKQYLGMERGSRIYYVRAMRNLAEEVYPEEVVYSGLTIAAPVTKPRRKVIKKKIVNKKKSAAKLANELEEKRVRVDDIVRNSTLAGGYRKWAWGNSSIPLVPGDRRGLINIQESQPGDPPTLFECLVEGAPISKELYDLLAEEYNKGTLREFISLVIKSEVNARMDVFEQRRTEWLTNLTIENAFFDNVQKIAKEEQNRLTSEPEFTDEDEEEEDDGRLFSA